MKRFYRVFSLFLALMLCVSLLPVGAAALEVPDMDALQSVVEAVAEAELSEPAVLTEEEEFAPVEVREESSVLQSDSGEKVVLYSAMTESDLNTLVACFNEVYPDIEVQIVNASAGELLSRLRSEAEDPVADVMWGGLSDSDGDANADVFEKWISQNDANNLPGYTSPNDIYSMTHLSTVVFCINTELEEELGLNIRSYEDLLDAALRGQITTADPNSSSSAWNNLSNIMAAYGTDSDEAWAYIERLMPNLVVLGSSSQVFRQVQQGEYVVGLTYEDGAVTLLKNGADNVKLVYPAEGTSAAAYGAALVKGAPHEENAKLLIDFLCSAEGQTAMAAAQEGTLRYANANYETPENAWLVPASEITWVARDVEYMTENKASILEHWNELWAGIDEPVLNESICIDKTNFPDDNFRGYVSEEFDADGDGYLSTDEIAAVRRMYCSGMDIESLQGIEYFTNLYNLSCENNNLSSLDISSLDNLEYLTCDEEAIGGINLTATEDGYTADLSAISHLLDDTWEIGAGSDMWNPTIASVYDASTGMATFAMRPKVIMFGEENEWGYWDAYIAIYVSDADLPKLAAPTELQWGVEYSWEFGLDQVPVEHPGMISWLNAENPGLSYELSVDIYGDTGEGFRGIGGMGTSLNGDYSYGYWSETRFIEDDPETGDYYFTVQYVGDGQTCADSEMAKSEVFHYTKPDVALGACGTPTWTEDGKLIWNEPENAECVDYYDIGIYYSDTADGDFRSGYGSRAYTNEFDSENFDWVIEQEGSAYYSIRVRAISSDITQCCNSEWSELSEPRYFSGEETPEDLPVGDMDGDGYVLANDLVSLMKSLVSGEVDAATNPDINKDGNVDVLDVIRLIRMMAGLV